MRNDLIVFPCAGGNAQNYLQFSKDIQAEVIRIEYSGHWSRYNETVYNSFEDLLSDVESHIKDKIGIHDNIFLFGHSMGACVAYEIAKQLIKEKYNVKCLMISACATMQEINWTELDMKTESDVKKFLNRIRQMPEKVLNSSFFEDNLLHPIQNDFKILTDYIKSFKDDATVACPIVCFQGREDILVKDMSSWKNYTTSGTMVHSFHGGHFFLYEKNNYRVISKYVNDIICQYGAD